MKRIGIYSGTFDPIHEGHILFASTAIGQFGLDLVVFMPEPKPRRKADVTALDDREAMLALSLQEYPQMEMFSPISEQEFTVESTMRAIVEKYPDCQYAMLMGADVFEYINKENWPGLEDIRESVGFIVALRTEDDGEIVTPLAKELNLQAEFMQSALATVSSSKIRAALKNDKQPIGLDDNVQTYITSRGLYR